MQEKILSHWFYLRHDYAGPRDKVVLWNPGLVKLGWRGDPSEIVWRSPAAHRNVRPDEADMQWQGQQWKLLERVIHFLFFLFSTIWQHEYKTRSKKCSCVQPDKSWLTRTVFSETESCKHVSYADFITARNPQISSCQAAHMAPWWVTLNSNPLND